MAKHPLYNKKLYGTATVGTKGQVVIPAEAREELGIEPGDRLYVIGTPTMKYLGLLKEEALQAMVETMTEQIEQIEQFRDARNNKGEQ